MKLAIHLATSARGYGYFGDEPYYLACADHLAWGYVDHPPLSIGVLAGWTALFGDSLAALRTLPALFGAASVVAMGVLTRDLGGGARAQALAALVFALAPVNLVIHGYYSMNAIDILVWLLAFILFARLVRDPTPARWLGLGALLGLGLLNKFSVAWLGAGLFVGLCATPHRRLLASSWPWLAGLVAALVFAPHLAWQVAHDFPTREFIATATTRKMVPVGPLELFAQQVLVMNPLVLPLWAVGLYQLLRRGGPGPERVFGIVFVVTAAILVANGTSRPNYLTLAQPPLVAAGAIAVERLQARARWRWLPATAIGVVAVLGLLGSVLTLPWLPPQALAGGGPDALRAPEAERREVGALDPHFADMIGWPVIVGTVADVWAALPAADREQAGLIGFSYSEAGALDLLGAAHGLPPAASPHNGYWRWGPGSTDGAVMVMAGGPLEVWQRYWARVEPVVQWDCGLCLPSRNHQWVYVARDPKRPIEEIWAELRRYD